MAHPLDGIRRRAVWVGILLALAGCAGWVERIGVVVSDEQTIGVKLLRPQVTARSCSSSLLGFPLGSGRGDLDQAMRELLARDEEANLLTNVELRRRVLLTGVYNRRCVEVHGDLGRTVTTLTLPLPRGHGSHQ